MAQFFKCKIMLEKNLPLVALFFILLATITGFLKFRDASLPWRILIIFSAYTLLSECISEVLSRNGYNTLWLINIFILLQDYVLIIVGTFFLNKNRRKLFFFALFICTCLWFYQLYDVGIMMLFQHSMLLSCVVLLLLYFNVLFRFMINSQLPMSRNPGFWFCIAVIIFYGCSGPIFSAFIYLNFVKKDGEYSELYTLINVLSAIEFILITISFYLLDRRNKFYALSSEI